MAFSIEARTPFLDFRVVDWVFSGNADWFYAGGETKAPLRKVADDIAPSNVVHRRDKMGFVTPELKWYQENRTEVVSKLTRSNSNLWAWMNRQQWVKVLEERSISDFGFAPWRWMIFDKWFDDNRLNLG